jgi:hypothetical protein
MLNAWSAHANERYYDYFLAFLLANSEMTSGCTNCDISPPNAEISLTSVEEINEQSFEVGKNTYSS